MFRRSGKWVRPLLLGFALGQCLVASQYVFRRVSSRQADCYDNVMFRDPRLLNPLPQTITSKSQQSQTLSDNSKVKFRLITSHSLIAARPLPPVAIKKNHLSPHLPTTTSELILNISYQSTHTNIRTQKAALILKRYRYPLIFCSAHCAL